MYLVFAIVIIVYYLVKEAFQRAKAEAFAEKYDYDFKTGQYIPRK